MNTQCAAQHFGLWVAKPDWLSATVAAYAAGNNVHVGSVSPMANGTPVYLQSDDAEHTLPLYALTDDGIAVVSINGQITKGTSSFGGTSSVRTRQAMRHAEANDAVRGIMLAIDSPGGTVAGQVAMADEIARIAKAGIKPVHAHAEDAIHSAALWAGTQASKLTASQTTEVGSIGVVAAVNDYSGAYEKEGIKVHVISTGDYKGAMTPGTEVTDDMLSQVQRRVDDINTFFVDAIRRGRGMSDKAVRKLATGEDWLAADAAGLKLIDAVMTDEQAMQQLRRDIKSNERQRAAKARAARSRARAAAL